MGQAQKKLKKQPEIAQSTDRAGFLLLPLGLIVLAFGFMLAMGVTLQTSSKALYFFNEAAKGTGGMLTYAVPAFFLWLGALLCAASKRRVSFAVFIDSLLLVLSVAAMMNLTLRVYDTQLMEYVGINARGIMDYLRAPFLMDPGILSLSGGAMGMLLAYPLYTLTNSFIGAVALSLVIIALVFGLLRVSPARLYRMLAGGRKNKAVQTGPEPLPDISAQPQPKAEPADIPIPEPQPKAAPKPRREEAPLPGFVPQPAAAATLDAFVPSAQSVAPPPEPAPAPVPAWPGVATAVLEAEPAPVRTPRRTAPKPDTAPKPAPAPVIAKRPEPVAEQPKPVPRADPKADKPTVAPARPQPAPAKAVKASDGLLFTPGLDGVAKPSLKPMVTPPIGDYDMPPATLLTAPPQKLADDTTQEDRERALKLIKILDSFDIPVTLQEIVHGPAVTRFAIRLAEGVNVNKLYNVLGNLKIELKAKEDLRVESPIPGTSFVGLEVSNQKTSTVYLREVLTCREMQNNPSPTCVAVGLDITGVPVTCELLDMPHLLIAGATGSGKSVTLNSIICSLLYRSTPRQVRMLMIDPKLVELFPYSEIPHLLMPVVSDVKKAALALEWVCNLMDERYVIMKDAGVRKLSDYNARLGPGEEPLPSIIVIVDEIGDMMTTKASKTLIETHIKRITAKARAAGISIVMATQRPSVDVLGGVIKANIPARIALKVSSPFDSRTILNEIGAETLLGHGDMLYQSSTQRARRVQGCYVADADVDRTLEYIKAHHGADYDPDLVEYTEKPEQMESAPMSDANDDSGDFDEKLQEAIEMAVESGQMSISMLQRVMRVGYARAGRLIDEMARRGVISGNEGTKARKTLMTREQYYNELEKGGGKL